MITGSHPRSEDLWAEEVIIQMESRFGVRCLSSLERKNLSRYAAAAVVVATCVVSVGSVGSVVSVVCVNLDDLFTWMTWMTD